MKESETVGSGSGTEGMPAKEDENMAVSAERRRKSRDFFVKTQKNRQFQARIVLSFQNIGCIMLLFVMI